MNKKKFAACMMLAVFILALVTPVSAYAAGSSKKSDKQATLLEVTESGIKNNNAVKAIQSALDQAGSNASESHPYRVKVPEGTYTLTGGLKIYSNTTLDLTGVTLKRDCSSNMIHVGAWESSGNRSGASGYSYENVAIIGGTLDGSGSTVTIVKAGHCKNFSMTGTTLKNLRNGHICEIAGVNGCYIYKCNFEDQVLDAGHYPQTFEAIQLDVLSSDHFPGYRAEALANKNVIIDSCTFDNVPRGIGSHSAIMNVKFSNIQITNNTFENLTSCAVQAMNWKNVTISGNKITDAPRGIVIYSMRNNGSCSFYPGKLASQGGVSTDASDSYQKPEKNQKIVISDNEISLSDGSDAYSSDSNAGIQISGTHVFSSANIAAGYYYLSGVTVEDNVIETNGYGVLVNDTRKLKILRNTITGTGGACDGISLSSASSASEVGYNYISESGRNGVYLTGSSVVKSLVGNSIYSAEKAAVWVENSSKIKTSQYNGVLKCGAKFKVKDKGKIKKHLDNYTFLVPVINSLESENGTVKISWEGNGGAKYRIYRREKDAADAVWKKAGETGWKSYKDKNVETGKTYYYLVRSVTGDGKTYTSYYDQRSIWKVTVK